MFPIANTAPSPTTSPPRHPATLPPRLTDAQRAQAELARRELARRDLIEFCAYVDPAVAHKYRAAHLQLIAGYIQQAEADTLWQGIPGSGKKILIITCPPGHWKSSLVSRKLPAWFVGKRQREGRPYQVILTSYNAELAKANNGKVLELINSPLYHNVFPDIKLSPKEQSSEKWSLAGEPFTTCKAAGRGGGLTGYHAAMAIVDDPLKDRKEANSVATIEELWDWWKDVLRTRLLDDSSFILGIWTRWSEEDPAGRLMKAIQQGESDERVVMVRLPALAETQAERASAAKLGLPVDEADPLGRRPGEALWPEEESAEEHLATKRAYPLTFDSLYQGRPRPAGGYLVGQGQFKILPAMPTKDVRYLWGTDWAITEKETAPKGKRDPDYTVAALVGLWTPDGNRDDARLVIAYIVRGQHNPHDARQLVKEALRSTDRRYPMRSGQANMDKIHLHQMRRDADLLNFSLKNLDRGELSGDKVAKAQPWLEKVHAGSVYVVQGPWNDDFFSEVENFPHGAHDDQVDAISVAVHALGLAKGPRKAKSQRMSFYG
jgi:predicted phage terminase large subunit-like protein